MKLMSYNIDWTTMDSPRILWQYTGSGTGETSNWGFSVPISSLVYDNSTNMAKYSKVVLEVVFEQTSGTGMDVHLEAVSGGGTLLDCDRTGINLYGTSFSNMRTTSSFIGSIHSLTNNSNFIKLEIFIPKNVNWVTFAYNCFSGQINDSGSQWVQGRIKTAINNISSITLTPTVSSAIPKVSNSFQVRLWGYK